MGPGGATMEGFLRIAERVTRSHAADKKLESHNQHALEKFIQNNNSADDLTLERLNKLGGVCLCTVT